MSHYISKVFSVEKAVHKTRGNLSHLANVSLYKQNVSVEKAVHKTRGNLSHYLSKVFL